MRVWSTETFAVCLVAFQRLAVGCHKVADGRAVKDFLLQLKGELGALAVFAFHVQLAVHQRKQVVHDVHAKSRAFDAAVARFLQPLKCLEEPRQVFLLHADARVLDAETDHNFVVPHIPP